MGAKSKTPNFLRQCQTFATILLKFPWEKKLLASVRQKGKVKEKKLHIKNFFFWSIQTNNKTPEN